ncbi:MAG: response regulator [Verrucomicrobiota bacterium]
MKTLLVLSSHPEMADTIRAGLTPDSYRIIHRTGQDEAYPMLAHGLAHGVIVDIEFNGVQNIWLIERLRRRNARCPIIVYTGAKQSEWEEEAYLRGASHVLSKPVRPRALAALLERLFAVAAPVVTPALPRVEVGSSPVPGRSPGGGWPTVEHLTKLFFPADAFVECRRHVAPVFAAIA